jgi:hypothetical protein
MDSRQPLEAIVFKPIYPPRNDLGNLTYFGGYPTLSKRLVWPLGPKTGRPITFLGQVELSKLPQILERSALPSSGVLHFFGNNDDYMEPDSTFPYLWVHIELWCNQLLSDRTYLHFTKDQKQEPGMARECSDWIKRAQSPGRHTWFKRAQSQGRLTRTTATDVDVFWNWVRSLDTRRKNALPGTAIADYGMRIANGAATPADRAALQAILKRPELVWRNALQTIPQQAEKFASGAFSGKETKSFLDLAGPCTQTWRNFDVERYYAKDIKGGHQSAAWLQLGYCRRNCSRRN